MQIRFIPLVKFIYYKSRKFGGWVGKQSELLAQFTNQVLIGRGSSDWVGKVGGGGHGIKTIHRQDNSPTRFLRQFTDIF